MSASWPGKAELMATLRGVVAAFKEAGGRLDFVPGVSGGKPSNRWAKTPTQPELLRENIANESKGAAEISNGLSKKQRKRGKVSARRRLLRLEISNGLSTEKGRKSAKVSTGSSRIE
jgi:hypothetical protein